jgi:phage shock protein E
MVSSQYKAELQAMKGRRNMNIRGTSLIAILLTAAMLSACAEAPSATDATSGTLSSVSAETAHATYIKITPEEAKSLIDTEEVIVLDVRTQEEYDAGHIDSAIRLEYTDFADMAASVLPDKDATILVYCRSGNRSKTASEMLIEMGYTKVMDFGGIIDWPYDIVT